MRNCLQLQGNQSTSRWARPSDLVSPVIQAVIHLIGAEMRAESLQNWCQRLSKKSFYY
jgi:hypothetical protein